MEGVKLVAGLGNPGPAYAGTRHNLGAEVVVRVAENLGVPLSHASRGARWGRGRDGNQAVVLALPQTYMNDSGRAVGALARYYRLTPESVLVVADDLALDAGRMRFRRGGGSGGHNGLKSVAAALGSESYPRLRLGIGRPPEGQDPADYVLSRFRSEERRDLDSVLSAAAAGVRTWITRGIDAAMQAANR